MPDEQRAFREVCRRLGLLGPSKPATAKPLVTLDRTRLTMDEVWMLWRDGFDVSAELERRYGL